MSRSKRNGVWVDEGPSSAAAADPVAMHGRLAIPGLTTPIAGGAGPIERRQVTAAERDARAQPALSVAAAVTEPVDAPAPAQDELEEEPDVAEPAPARNFFDPPPIDAELLMPCRRCLHEPICAIRQSLKPGAIQIITLPLDKALTVSPTITVDCGWFLEDKATAALLARARALSPVDRLERNAATPRRRRPGGDQERTESIADRATRVLEVLARHGGNTKAAGAELGMRGNVVARIAHSARARQAASA